MNVGDYTLYDFTVHAYADDGVEGSHTTAKNLARFMDTGYNNDAVTTQDMEASFASSSLDTVLIIQATNVITPVYNVVFLKLLPNGVICWSKSFVPCVPRVSCAIPRSFSLA